MPYSAAVDLVAGLGTSHIVPDVLTRQHEPASHVEVVHQWRQHIRDGLVLPVEDLSSPRDDYIRWYRDITRVYISSPACCDTRTIGYQPTGVLEGPPSSPTQYASLSKKVQTIICRCMVSIGSTLGRTPSQHDIQQTFLVHPSRRRPREPGIRRLSGGGACRGRAPAPPHSGGRGHADPGHGGKREMEDLEDRDMEMSSLMFPVTRSTAQTWMFNLIVTHGGLVRKILKHQGMDPNFWRVRMIMRVPSFYAKYRMFNFTLYSMNNDDEMRYLWTIRPNTSKEGIRILIKFEPI
ncbi:hypothetical protein M9H77_04668 [Catharanthus roseus]|uniref:Uncharacterized protein n=1 Tax=Catharanthus roseus TaxID=4058 RepID=A0ACC0CEV4_CATRO|nr:hypothetical protein M9H77_04668 [Catharanthus roseus]